MDDPFTPAGLAAAVDGEPAFRARQVTGWLARGVDDPEAMTDLPARPAGAARRGAAGRTAGAACDDRRRGSHAQGAAGVRPRRRSRRSRAHAVPRRSPTAAARATVCVSTQAGCAMGCPFCATGQVGLRRQLTTAEVCRQVTWAQRLLQDSNDLPGGVPDHVTNVVFMGMGEPLANLDVTVAAVRWLTAAVRPVRPRRHGQHRRPRARHPPPPGAGPAAHAGRLAARPGRRAARRPRPDQPRPPAGGAPGRQPGLPGRDPATPDVRVHPHRRDQRRTATGRAARGAPAAPRPRRARTSTSSPTTRRPGSRGEPRRAPPATHSPSGCSAPASPPPCAAPAARRSTPPAASSTRPTPWAPAASSRRPRAPPTASPAHAGAPA